MKKLGSRGFARLALVACMAFASNAHAVWTFNQTNVTGRSETTPDLNAGDPKVSLTGVYAANSAGNAGFDAGAKWAAGTLTWFNGNGQGMYTGNDTGTPYHALDNNGNTEAVLLNFTQSVALSSIGLGYAANTAGTNGPVDISLFRWIGSTGTPTGAPTPLVGQTAAAMTGWELVGNYGDMVVDTSNPFIAKDIPSADESMVVIRFANPKGIDFPYLLNMINDSWMSRANTIVVPGGKMELAMQLIFTPFVWRMMERQKKA